MWQAGRKSRHGQKGKKGQAPQGLHLKRASAQVKLLGGAESPESIWDVRLFFNDVSPEAFRFFSPEPIEVGREVAVTMDDPVRVYARGKVISCTDETQHRIIQEQSYNHRVTLRLRFEGPTEKEDFGKFCKMLADKYIRSSISD
jgi:hypothetical protein